MILAPHLLPDLSPLELVELDDHATDPGREVLDLPDDLALSEVDVSLPALVAPVALFRAVSAADYEPGPDYEPATWLARVLRRAGVSVVKHPGWKGNGRPRSAGPFTPRGLLWHHDGSAVGPSPAMARFIAETGRPDAGIPAPLAQCWVCVGCGGRHPAGTWHLLAAGRANHAGYGAGWGKIPRDAGNSTTIGVEVDNTTGEPTPAAVYDSLVLGSAAILRELRRSPAHWLAGHKEYAAGRKVDPDDINMPRARVDVARTMRALAGLDRDRPRSESRSHNETDPPATPPACACPGGCVCGRRRRPKPGDAAGAPAPRPAWSPRPFPGRQHFALDARDPFVALLRGWLVDAGLLDEGQRDGDAFTRLTRRAVRRFQLQDPALAGDPDGYPGPMTWRRLQVAARDARRRRRAQ